MRVFVSEKYAPMLYTPKGATALAAAATIVAVSSIAFVVARIRKGNVYGSGDHQNKLHAWNTRNLTGYIAAGVGGKALSIGILALSIALSIGIIAARIFIL